MGGCRSHRDLSVAHPVFAHPPPLWVFSVITMEMLLRAFNGVKEASPLPNTTRKVAVGLFFLNCYVFITHKQKQSQ